MWVSILLILIGITNAYLLSIQCIGLMIIVIILQTTSLSNRMEIVEGVLQGLSETKKPCGDCKKTKKTLTKSTQTYFKKC